MRIAVINQRLSLTQGAVDLHAASGGRPGPGDVLTSYIEGIGEMSHRFVPGRS